MSACVRILEPLSLRLINSAELGRADSYYRLARMVARVLTSNRLRKREKWRTMACGLADHPGVEKRLVAQALRWLERGHNRPVNA